MARLSSQRLAQIAITIQFLALVRTGAEFFRLRAVQGPAFTMEVAALYATGAMMAAVGAWASTTCYFFGRFRTAAGVVGGTIVAMLLYRFTIMS